MKTEQGRVTSISQLLLHVVCHPDHLELLQLLPGQLLGPAPQSLLGNLLHTLSIPCSCLLQGNKFKLNYREIKQRNLKSFYAWTSQHEYHMSPWKTYNSRLPTDLFLPSSFVPLLQELCPPILHSYLLLFLYFHQITQRSLGKPSREKISLRLDFFQTAPPCIFGTL